MARVTLPTGCTGLDMADGTTYTGAAGSTVQISDEHARAIRTGHYGSTGIMLADTRFSFGTKTGRLCAPCKRVWNAWNTECPRCSGPTTKVEPS